MSASGSKSLPAIGFLTVLEQEEQGLFGGYLILNCAGRPLEFHCTAPVKANRAQEILYGTTLRPYLYGEQIGQTLLAKSKTKPLFVCTDVAPALSVRDLVKTPVVLVEVVNNDDTEKENLRIDAAHADIPKPKSAELIRFSLGGHELAVASSHEGDRDQTIKHWEAHADKLDLTEPFMRIREAIDEAQRSAAR